MAEKRRIAVIGLKGLPAFGGAATAGENIIGQLSTRYEFTVYSVSSHTAYPTGMRNGYYQKVFRAVPFKGFNVFLYYVRSALHALFSGRYHLIHLHHIDGAFILPLLKLRYPVISTAHAKTYINGKWPAWVNSFFRLNEKVFLRLSDQITTVGKPLADDYALRTRKTVHHIPNGVDPTEPPVELPAEKGYMLFSAGRIIPLKGLHILLQAMKNIPDCPPLIVLGDLSQMESYRLEIVQLAAGLSVEFKGLVREKPRLFGYLKNARLFIFPSFSENMSIMLLEASSMKVPVICSNIVENTSIFSETESLHFQTGDPAHLQLQIQWALNHPVEMAENAARAHKKLETTFNWPDLSGQYAKLYEIALNNKR